MKPDAHGIGGTLQYHAAISMTESLPGNELNKLAVGFVQQAQRLNRHGQIVQLFARSRFCRRACHQLRQQTVGDLLAAISSPVILANEVAGDAEDPWPGILTSGHVGDSPPHDREGFCQEIIRVSISGAPTPEIAAQVGPQLAVQPVEPILCW